MRLNIQQILVSDLLEFVKAGLEFFRILSDLRLKMHQGPGVALAAERSSGQ
jgi:hypothetical protein